MSILNIGRRFIEAVVAQFGYKLVFTKQQPPAHRVFNAFFDGFCFKVVEGTIIGDTILQGGRWDSNLEQLIDAAIKKNRKGIIVEVGANIGASILPLCNKHPDTMFYLFEPVPRFFELLKENCSSMDVHNAVLKNLAVSSESGQNILISLSHGTAGAGVIDSQIIGDARFLSVTIDEIFESSEIAFMKIDVDGYELEVLRGAAASLRKAKPGIFIEFYPRLLRSVSVDPAAVLKCITDVAPCQFTVYKEDGTLLASSVGSEEVLELANAAKHYVDLFVSYDG